jgi:hypothetical protein
MEGMVPEVRDREAMDLIPAGCRSEAADNKGLLPKRTGQKVLPLASSDQIA